MIPVYPASAKFSSWKIAKSVQVLLDTLDVGEDPLPAALREREGLVGRAATQGGKLLQRLTETLADHPLVGEIRGTGLIGAIELVADKERRKFFPSERRVGLACRNHCFESGLVMRAVRDTMVFAPPFTITDAEIAEFTQLAVRAIDLTWRDVEQEPG